MIVSKRISFKIYVYLYKLLWELAFSIGETK